MTKYAVPYGGPVIGEEERTAVIDAYDSGVFWDGTYTREFEKALAEKVVSKRAIFTNSGSSALLLALASLGLKKSKVLNVALTFPTGINIIPQTGNTPVLIDVKLNTLNLDSLVLDKAIAKHKPKVAIITHVIGNSPDMKAVRDVLVDRKVIGIEDSCDCLGGKFDTRYVGTFLDSGCYSFHPAHPMTAGIGGAVVTDDEKYAEVMRRMRDWGRIPQDYPSSARFFDYRGRRLDKRYTYTDLGYNLMCSEFHAAMGIAQLAKLEDFVKMRKYVWDSVWDTLKPFAEDLILPRAEHGAEPVWFGFPVIRSTTAKWTKEQFMTWLEEQGVETRSIYGGPVVNQPAYVERGVKYKVFGTLENSQYLSDNAFWVSCWHGLKPIQIEYLSFALTKFLKGDTSG